MNLLCINNVGVHKAVVMFCTCLYKTPAGSVRLASSSKSWSKTHRFDWYWQWHTRHILTRYKSYSRL